MDSERLKELETAEEELRRRRERGKLAQRKFRERQINKLSKGKSNEARTNQRLKAAIEKITKVARSDDRPELLQAIREAAEITGSDAWWLGENNDGRDEGETATTELSPSSSYPLPYAGTPLPIGGAQLIGTTSTNQGVAQGAFPHLDSCADMRQNSEKSTSFDTGLTLERVGPRLGYGLWFNAERFVRIDNPPLDIVPYLGKGMKTFAGRLFWNCGEYLLNLCRRAEAYSNTDPLVAREANEKIWNMVQHSPPLHNMRYIIAMAEARHEFRDRGYIEGNNPAGEADSAELLHELVLADYKKRGDDTAIWLSASGVENELRRFMSDGLCERLERVLENWDLGRQAGDPLAKMIQSLIHTLSSSFICFGNGPRWRADRVAAMFSGNA
ncbi:uncharacterized protein F4807DRAFT_453538 [Annulohypoxylon truncatum]|uniref:uncharacterized protein n=1 Tax=Annulohypoxylon truncatum TaxID=327061 RepID=UPI0020072236|nr:uncharacterized protein F4807DRAFT_453538 [Annulohypoxylon truncatum]KAI1206367.1 hypothetical protein F4807DRAFT_453538 [Annulohypoxylon truncatum]